MVVFHYHVKKLTAGHRLQRTVNYFNNTPTTDHCNFR